MGRASQFPRRRGVRRRRLLAWILIGCAFAVLLAPLALAASQVGTPPPAEVVSTTAPAEVSPLSSTAAVVAASWAVVYALKRYLAPYPKFAAVPVPVYLVAVSFALTYYANRVAGTLPGSLGALLVEVLKNGAITSGLREWLMTGTAPLSASGVARDALDRAR